jgi:hypothetical protein
MTRYLSQAEKCFFHSPTYDKNKWISEEYYLLRCDVMHVGRSSHTFWSNTPASMFRTEEYITQATSNQTVVSFLLLAWLTLQTWRWKLYIPPRRQWTFSNLHGVTSQRTVLSQSLLWKPPIQVRKKTCQMPSFSANHQTLTFGISQNWTPLLAKTKWRPGVPLLLSDTR